MKIFSKPISILLAILLSISFSIWGITAVRADEIDVSYLQTCLKEEGSSLDVLVLMDASASLRDARKGDAWYPKPGSDPEKKRGKILKSSLKLLQTLASESQRPLNINLRTFGKNSDPKELQNLEVHSVNWTDASSGNFDEFIEKALYDDSTQTEWASALASAKNQFNQRIGKATLDGKKSCPVMFWITDGAPTDSTASICASDTNSSIDWFRKNNILVLGGLLQPKDEGDREKARQFRPIVTGENCGKNQPGWTRGEVIEAKDIGDLAWKFVGLVAGIKNLINLRGNNSTFFVDPGSSHIEIFIRGSQQTWIVKAPDGSVVCSSANLGNFCKVSADSEIGIVTITVFPESPAKSAGTWTVTPNIDNESFQVYASLNTASKETQKTQPRLLITPKSGSEIDEGKSAIFEARIVNADGSNFAISGFKNVSICAKVASSDNQICKSGANIADLSVSPVSTDKSVAFEAILTSAHDDKRNYRLAASQKINVIPSGIYPSLVCGKDPCVFQNLKNKTSKSVNILEVKPAANGSNEGKISLAGFTILADAIVKRGDGHFRFEAEKPNGEQLNWPSEDQFLVPGDKINLAVSTDMAGDAEIIGVLKYKVYSGEQQIIRQLQFKMNIGHESNKLVQIGLLLLAYLITLGIPYSFLLWSARKSAVLDVLFNEIGYVSLPFQIDSEGKIRENESAIENTFKPDYTKLNKIIVEPGTRSIKIENVVFEVIPPKWNPFNQTKTIARFPDNYLFSTVGKPELKLGESIFSSTLLDEAIFYFPTFGNISADKKTKTETLEESTGLSFLDSAYEVKMSEVVESPTGPVKGTVMFLISPYVTPDNRNKEKSLAELVEKIKPIMSGFNFAEAITQLRAQSLKELKETLAIKKGKEKPEQKVTSKIEQSMNQQLIDDEWGSGSSINSTKSDLPESRRNDDA